MSKEEKKKKPGFMQRLFSSKKLSVDDEKQDRQKNKEKKLQRMHTVDPAALSRDGEPEKKQVTKPKSKDDSAVNGKPSASKSSGARARTNGEARPKPKPKPALTREGSGKKRRKKKKRNAQIDIDVSKGLAFPCTPEIILEYHKNKPFLAANEEWLMVELNEFECLVDSMKIVKIIAKHSKFFEVEPDELWEEFFEWVDDIPAYDEVINYDIWQEFRDKKYPM